MPKAGILVQLSFLKKPRVLISHITIAFQNCSLKIPIQESLQFVKFDSADFKYGKSFLKLHPKITKIRT